MRFKSDFSKLGFSVLLIPVFLILIISAFTEKDINLIIFPPIGLFAFLVVIFTILYFTTYYEIREDILIISFFFIKTKIKISEIRSIKYSNSFIKTNLYKPGFHYKGLEVLYNKFDDIYISPKNKEQFIAQLQEINPNIE